MNSINVILPYKHNGVWAFDDPSKDLHAEPFVGESNDIIDILEDLTLEYEDESLLLMFAAIPFPGAEFKFQHLGRGDFEFGDWYHCPELEMNGWLCPALLEYFHEAPKQIHVQAKAVVLPCTSHSTQRPRSLDQRQSYQDLFASPHPAPVPTPSDWP